MSILHTVKRRLWNDASERSDAELVFGLPLEVGARKIYPVYLEGREVNRTKNGPRQIGYVEISDGRAVYTSLEPDYRWPVVLAGLSALLLVATWVLRRVRR
jgi:hypothetical protein